MRLFKYFLLLYLTIFLCSLNVQAEVKTSGTPNPASYANGEIIVSQVSFVVNGFVNQGDSKYDYLGNFLSVFLESALKKIPFFTITEKQKNQLISSVSLNYYLSKFTGRNAPDRPIIYVKPKISVFVYRGKSGALPFSINFFGKYRVDNDNVYIEISMSSDDIKLDERPYQIQAGIDDLIQHPERYFLRYSKSILNYSAFRVSINAEPEDSIISIDDRVMGIGRVNNILLTDGTHKLHIYRDGFKDYNDIITVLKDGFKKSVILKSLKYKKYLRIVSIPSGAEVYLNEDFMGSTPILLKIPAYDEVITIVKNGYISKVLYPYQYMDKDRLIIRLSVAQKLEKERILGESFKKRSKMLYYSGIGFLAATIILAAESNVYKQEAELYKDTNPQKYRDAANKKNMYGALASVSAFSSGVVFTFSFKDILKYFKIYENRD